MKRLLFSGDGSSGDLLPVVLMARQFKLAGYDITVCGSQEFAQMALDFEVPFEAYPHNYSKLYLDKQKPGYIHNMRANIEHQEALYQGEYDLLSKIAPDYDVIFNLAHEIFPPHVAEAYGIANIKLCTFPMFPCDMYAPPSGLPFVTRAGWFNRLNWQGALVAARYLFNYNSTVDRLRANLGLGPMHDLLANNKKCDHVMFGVYQDLMPPCPTYDFDYSYIGPCLPRTEVALSEPLEEFLAAGEKPIYIGFGSMRHVNGEELTRQLVESVRAVGVRAVIAQATSDIGASLDDAEDIYVLREYPIPHHVLFPRLAAAVHHGSWITTHLAAQAGIPQLVVAQASDQYIWADLLKRQGLGPGVVDMNRLKPQRLTHQIAELVGRPEFTAKAKAFGDAHRHEDGAKNAVELFQRIEDTLPKRR